MTNTQTTPPSSTSKRSRVLIPDTCVHCACAPACPCVRAYVCARAFVCVKARVSALMLTAGLHDQVLRLGALATFTPDSLHFLIKLRKRSLQVACKHARARARTRTRTHTHTHTHTHAHLHPTPEALNPKPGSLTQGTGTLDLMPYNHPKPEILTQGAGTAGSHALSCPRGCGRARDADQDRLLAQHLHTRPLIHQGLWRVCVTVGRLYRHRPASDTVSRQTERIVGQCAGSELCCSAVPASASIGCHTHTDRCRCRGSCWTVCGLRAFVVVGFASTAAF